MTPRQFVNSNYGPDDVFILGESYDIAGDPIVLRPETTMSSYTMAQELLNPHNKPKIRLPLAVWQAGKSFRVEKADGANPAKLRFNEFWQLEYQCLYSVDTKADYRGPAEEAVRKSICMLTGQETRMVSSDRLPSYSKCTRDVEIDYKGRWTEMCSISDRTDYGSVSGAEGVACLEIAVGLDRLVEAWNVADWGAAPVPGHC